MANCQFDSLPPACTDCHGFPHEWIFQSDTAFQSETFSARVSDSDDPADVCRSMPEHLHGFRRCRKSNGWYKEFPGAAGESYSDYDHQQECCPRRSGETGLRPLKGCFLPVAKFFIGQCRNLRLKFGINDKFKLVFLHRQNLLSKIYW